YRLLGSLAEAEDAVQEAYARWYAMPAQQREAIASPGAWLTTVASRICLDVLGAARDRRGGNDGGGSPEPLLDPRQRDGAGGRVARPLRLTGSSWMRRSAWRFWWSGTR